MTDVGSEKARILNEAYAQAMERINCQLRGFKKLALSVLSWIICAKRSLTTFELQEALAVEFGKSKLDKENVTRLDIVVSVCAGMVTIDEKSHIIRLVHYTAQEYFRNTQQCWFPNAEHYITKICLTYLSFREFERGPSSAWEALENRLQRHKFCDYAARYWGHHARSVEEELENAIQGFLQRQKNLLASVQVMLYNRASGKAPTVPYSFTELHVAAYFGLLKTVTGFLANGYHPAIEDGSYRTPASYAAQNGHEGIVALLFEATSQDQHSYRSHIRTPLSYAAEGGHLAIVITLLDTIAQPNFYPEGYELRSQLSDAVSRAAEKGHESVIRWLLKNFDVEINGLNREGYTPLSLSARKGHKTVVKLLLDSGKIRAASLSPGYCSPVRCAVRNGHEALAMRLLLPISEFDPHLLVEAVGNGSTSLFQQLLRFAMEQPHYTDRWLETPLKTSISHGRSQITELLLQAGNILSTHSNIPLDEMVLLCAKNGNSTLFHSFLQVDGIRLDAMDQHYRTALSYAAERGDVLMVKLLISRGLSGIGQGDESRKKPTHYAASNGHEDVALLLVESGKANVHQQDYERRSILSYAAEKGQLRLLNLLLEKMDPEANEGHHGLTALMFAAGSGQMQAAMLLLRKGAQLNKKDNVGQTPLMHAAKNGHENVLQFLLQQRCIEPNVMDSKGYTALSLAARNGCSAVVNRLLDLDSINPNLKTVEIYNSGRTPLSFAAATGRPLIVQSLVASDRVDVAAVDDQGRTALSYAAENGSLEVMKFLIGTGKVNPDHPDSGASNAGRTPIWYAAKHGHTAIVRYLLTEHVNINATASRNDAGKTPLTWAAENGHEEIVKILVNHKGVFLNAEALHIYTKGRTPLSFAAENGHASIVELLLRQPGIEVDAIDGDGQTPLFWAAKTGHSFVVELLLRTGKILVDRKDNYGQTPLFYAAGSPHSIVIKLLLDTGKVDANAPDENGRTPLFPAAARGFVTAVNLLLNKGHADPNHTDFEDKAPIWFAKGRGHNSVVRILLEAGAVEPVCEEEAIAPSYPLKISRDWTRDLLPEGNELYSARNGSLLLEDRETCEDDEFSGDNEPSNTNRHSLLNAILRGRRQ